MSLRSRGRIHPKNGRASLGPRRPPAQSWLGQFKGTLDASGSPIWTDGELLVESVRRFKGQTATAVVLTKCDFSVLDAMNRRLLFVGLTRARVHLEWVISSNLESVLVKHANL